MALLTNVFIVVDHVPVPVVFIDTALVKAAYTPPGYTVSAGTTVNYYWS